MSNTILSGGREPHQSPPADLNALYHPPKRPLTALGIVSAFIPLFCYGWQAMTGSRDPPFRQESASASTSARRTRRTSPDDAVAAMLDWHCLHITLFYALGRLACHLASASATPGYR